MNKIRSDYYGIDILQNIIYFFLKEELENWTKFVLLRFEIMMFILYMI
jgi:hypothetical protein